MNKLIIYFVCWFLMTTCAQLEQDQSTQTINFGNNLAGENEEVFDQTWAKKQHKELIEILAEYPKGDQYQKNYLLRKLYLRVIYYEKIFQFNFVEKYLEALVGLTGQDFTWETKLAVVYLRNGHFEKAQVLLEKVYEHNKGENKLNAGIVLGALYDTLGNYDGAIKVYKDILKNKPGQFDACLKVAQVKKKKYGFKAAIKMLNKCSQNVAVQEKSKFDMEIAKLYIEKKDYQKAEKFLLKALKEDPSDSLPLIILSNIWENQGKRHKIIGSYEKFLKKNPDDQRVITRLIDLYVQEQNIKKMVYHLERLSDLQNSNIQVRFKLALIYRELKRYEDSNQIFKEILMVDNVDYDRVYFYQYLNFKDLDDYKNGIGTLSKINIESPLYLEASIHIANMYRGWYEIADSVYNKNKIESNFFKFTDERKQINEELNFELSINEVLFLEDINRVKEAISKCNQLKAHKKFTKDHYYFLANLLEKDNQFEQADELIWGIIKKDPKSAHAWNFLGYSMLIRPNGDLNKAYEYIQKAISLAPEDYHIRDSLGWYYYKKNEYHLAVKELMFAAKGLPDDKTITEHLALALEKINDYFNAVVYYKKLKSKTKNLEKMKFIDKKINELTELERRSPAAKNKQIN